MGEMAAVVAVVVAVAAAAVDLPRLKKPRAESAAPKQLLSRRRHAKLTQRPRRPEPTPRVDR